MQHAGRSVIVSGSTVAVGLLSMVLLPLPFIRSIGIGGMLIPGRLGGHVDHAAAGDAVAARAADQQRARDAERIVEGSDDASGFWGRWARLRHEAARPIGRDRARHRRRARSSRPAAEPERGAREGPAGRRRRRSRVAQRCRPASISPGIYKPFEILVEGGATQSRLQGIVRRVASTPGVDGAVAPAEWRANGDAIIEAIPSHDGASSSTSSTISPLQQDVLPAAAADGLRATLGGVAAEDRDFVHAVYGNFVYVLLFVILLTYLLLDARVPLARARAQGGDPEPRLARGRLRDHRLHLPVGPRLRGDLEHARRRTRSFPGSR